MRLLLIASRLIAVLTAGAIAAGCAGAAGAGHHRAHGDLSFEDADLGGSGDLSNTPGSTMDLSSSSDLAGADLSGPSGAHDLAIARDLNPVDLLPAPPDLTPPPVVTQHVHILIDNQCNTSTDPTEITSPLGQPLQLDFHNHSVDYNADVWMSYNGGFLDLAPGATWHEKYQHCLNPVPYDAYADVSIAGGGSSACPSFRMMIHCK